MGLERNFRQDVTHWPVTGTDGFGGFAFAEPILLRGRWEEKSEVFINQDNESVLSKAIVYVNSDVTNGDFVALGDFATEEVRVLDPTEVSAFRIRNYGKITDLSALQALRKLWL